MTKYDNPPIMQSPGSDEVDHNLNYEYMIFEMKEALEGLQKLVRDTEQRTINEQVMLVDIAHILRHLNRAYNLRHSEDRWPKSDFEELSKLSKDLLDEVSITS